MDFFFCGEGKRRGKRVGFFLFLSFSGSREFVSVCVCLCVGGRREGRGEKGYRYGGWRVGL